jgi:small GTP-binding protein
MGSDDEQMNKIVIVGLDQAGKTSILNILNQKYNLMDNIKPTVNISRAEIKVLGIPIICWDLGGQERFRKNFLTNFKVFEQTDSLFYIVDALNAVRYEEALQYYIDILNIFEKLKTKPKIVLCIHKIDPNLQNDSDTLEAIQDVKELFLPKSEDYEITTYITSIYDRRSIVEAFSKNIQQLITTLKPFKPLLESIALLLKLDAAILFDENLMILSDYYKSAEIEEVCLSTVYNSVFYMTRTNPKLAEHFTSNFELVLNVKNRTKLFNFTEIKFKGWNLYLLTMGEQKLDTKVVYTKFESIIHAFAQHKSE